MNHPADEGEQKNLRVSETWEEFEARRTRMETAFSQAVELALETVPETERLAVRKNLEAEKDALIHLALKERGPAYLAQRMEWLGALQSELSALQQKWPDVSPELLKELKRFVDEREGPFQKEIEERMKQTGVGRAVALKETLQNIFSQVQKSAQEIEMEQAQHPLGADERQRLERQLQEAEEQQRALLTLPKEERRHFEYGFGFLLEKKAKIDQRLNPDKPINILERAFYSKTLYPFTEERKRGEEERAQAAHEALMAQRRAAQELAPAQQAPTNRTSRFTQGTEKSPRPWWQIWKKKSNNPPVESPRG